MLQSNLSFLDVVMSRPVEPAIETLHECIEVLVAVGDRASEMEARQVLFRLYIVTQRYAAAGAFLRTNKERILAFGNPMQQLLFADAIGFAYFLREQYTEALGVSFYVLELPSLHAMYRQERMPLVDATLARVSAEIHEAAQEHAARLRALPLHTAMDALMSLFIRVTEQG